jgi:hypothetical protein
LGVIEEGNEEEEATKQAKANERWLLPPGVQADVLDEIISGIARGTITEADEASFSRCTNRVEQRQLTPHHCSQIAAGVHDMPASDDEGEQSDDDHGAGRQIRGNNTKASKVRDKEVSVIVVNRVIPGG